MSEELGAFKGLCQALRLLVDRSGQSHKDVAAKAGVSPSAFSRFLGGELNPRLPVLGKILEEGLEMTVLDLAEALYLVRADELGERSISMQELRDGVRTFLLRFQQESLDDDKDDDESPKKAPPE
jgi:transcriptional regulator with XRE-family HTH domain